MMAHRRGGTCVADNHDSSSADSERSWGPHWPGARRPIVLRRARQATLRKKGTQDLHWKWPMMQESCIAGLPQLCPSSKAPSPVATLAPSLGMQAVSGKWQSIIASNTRSSGLSSLVPTGDMGIDILGVRIAPPSPIQSPSQPLTVNHLQSTTYILHHHHIQPQQHSGANLHTLQNSPALARG